MEGIIVFAAAAVLSTGAELDKTNLMLYAGDEGAINRVKTPQDWEKRRAHILECMQEVMGPLPDASKKVPLDIQVIEETHTPGYVQKKITFAVEAWDRLPAYLLIPKNQDGKRPAMLCLHPTNPYGKDWVVGINTDRPNRNYAEELAQRGYVALAPDYPGFGEYAAARKALYAHGYVSAAMKGIWNHI